MSIKKLALIGGGNMGQSLLRGILRAQLFLKENVTVVDIDARKLEAVRESCGVGVEARVEVGARDADIVLLAVKPFTLDKVLEGLRDVVGSHQLVVSIMAGVESRYISDSLGTGSPVVRVMPNIAATVDAAASAMAAGPGATAEHLEEVEAIFAAVGDVVRVEERLLDAVTGLSGSGPAFVYLVIEALSDGGVRMGLPRDVALKLAAQTVFGAAKAVKETGEHPARLKDQVSTPAGTTIAGLHVLEECGCRAMLMSAVETATERSRELRS